MPAITATYASPTNAPFTTSLEHPQLPSTATTADRARYLADLRQRALELQEAANGELTARMEEDKGARGGCCCCWCWRRGGRAWEGRTGEEGQGYRRRVARKQVWVGGDGGGGGGRR